MKYVVWDTILTPFEPNYGISATDKTWSVETITGYLSYYRDNLFLQ
jgi:hypothetical protein